MCEPLYHLRSPCASDLEDDFSIVLKPSVGEVCRTDPRRSGMIRPFPEIELSMEVSVHAIVPNPSSVSVVFRYVLEERFIRCPSGAVAESASQDANGSVPGNGSIKRIRDCGAA